MIASFRQERSLNGHPLDVLKSGLQKYVRRGEEGKALYCVRELDSFADVEGGERIRTNTIHRLMIIYMEDVGLGDFGLWARVHKLVELLLQERKRAPRNRPLEIGALKCLVRQLCRAQKTRACSFIRAWARAQSITAPASMEEFQRQIAAKNWLCFCSFFVLWETEKRNIVAALHRAGVATYCGPAWKREIKTGEQFLTLLLPLAAHIFDVPATPRDWSPIEEDKWVPETQLIFDEYVYDKHVRGGNVANKTRDYFVSVSSQVLNEVEILPACFREAYEGPSAKRETRYKFIVRAQLTTSASKHDTYFARAGDSVIVVKGPYKDDSKIKQFIEFQNIKKSRNMPYAEAWCEWLIPDRWDKVPLGVRNKLDLARAWPFLLCSSLYGNEPIPRRIAESKLWPPTEVANMPAFNPLALTTEEEKLDWHRAVAFRAEFNIGDLADRNFISVGGRVYSIDEEKTAKKIDLETALKKNRYELFVKIGKDIYVVPDSSACSSEQ